MESICVITETRGFGGAEIHTLGLIGAITAAGVSVELVECGHRSYDKYLDHGVLSNLVSVVHADVSAGVLDEEKLSMRNWKTVWHAFVGQPEWKDLLKSVKSSVCVFPKNNNVKGSLGFLTACRRKFRHLVTIEHLEAEPAPLRQSRLWFAILPGMGFWWWKRRFVRSLGGVIPDRVVAVSEAVARRLVGDWGYPDRKVQVVRNGVAWADFARDARLGMETRAALGIPGSAFVVGMSTRLSREKGIDVALKAFKRLREGEGGLDAFLVIAGDGPDRAGLEKLARELGVADGVRFVGFVSRMQAVLSAYDAILFSSRVEGLPLGLLEGMAAGCIAVVTRVSGMPEAVDEAKGGWVVAAEDPLAIAEALRSVLASSSEERARAAEHMVRTVKERFDIERTHAELLSVLAIPSR